MSQGITDFPATVEAIQQGIDSGLHTAAQVYISQYEETLADFAIGESAPGRAAKSTTVFPWMSCTKMISAVAFAQLVERGLVHFDSKVSEVIPEFACKGKEDISFTNILNHTCGIRVLSLRWDEVTWDESIAAICAMPLEAGWEIGRTAGYHVGTSWFILGEAVRRLSGRTLEDYVAEEIFAPLGMNHSRLAIPAEIYNDPNQDIVRFLRSDVQPPRPAIDRYGKAPNKCRPGASGRGPIRELGKFMEMLLAGGSCAHIRLLSERSIELLSTPARSGLVDKTFGKTIDWGLGMMIDSKQYQSEYPYSFGPACSAETYGHNGNQSSAAYVDPEHDLVVCFVFNGLAGETKHQQRLTSVNAAIYEDLDLS